MFNWYYKDFLRQVFKIWRSISIIVMQEFSIAVLLKTLFSPWRKDTAPLSGSLDQIFRIIVENLISRFAGFWVRFFTILTGFIFLLGVWVLGSIIIILLFVLPILFPIGTLIVFLIYKYKGSQYPNLSVPISDAASEQLTLYLHPDARKIYQNSKDYSQFFQGLIKNERVLFILNHLGIPSNLFSSSINMSQIALPKILLGATKLCQDERISTTDLFLSCYLLDSQIQKFFENIKINKKDILNLIFLEKAFYQTINKPSDLLFPEKIRTSGGVGRLWSAGYTPTLDRFSREIAENISSENPLHFEAHKDTISEMEMILGRSGKHNIIVVGEPGIGKRTVALGIARKIIFGNTVPALAHHRITELNIDAMLAGSTSIGETEERLVTALNEAVEAGNIILFIDNIDRIFEQTEAKPGALDLSSTLIPYLERSDFRLIGTVTYEGYHKWIESNSNLAGAFEKIEIKEPTDEQTLKIIEELALYLESKHRILILYPALKEIVALSDKYIGDKKFPEKAIDLLDEACSLLVNQKKEKILDTKTVEELITLITKVPVGEVKTSEKEILINLEVKLHKRLVGQDEAVKEVAESLRRARTGIKAANKPIGSFLFLGPTGVGKTELAKTLAESYFGDENRMIRFDMSEYQEIRSISRLIGSKLGEPGILTSKVREKPFSLILFDEIEKAHPNILDLFLQILDEGRLTDTLGKTVDFKNAIIIATSNAGSEWIREQIQRGQTIDKKLFLDYLLKTGYFKPEFLNRFDGVIAFRPLQLQELEKVVELMINRLIKQLSEKQIKIELEEGAKKKLAKIGFDPQFGARALLRVIQDKVENQIAKAILEDKLQPGSTFIISEKMIQ